MKFITVTELKQRATQIITEIQSTKEEVIITKKGKPIVLMKFITDEIFNLKDEGRKDD